MTVVCTRENCNEFFVLKLQGLDPEKMYREELSRKVYSGARLMYAGLNLSEEINKAGISRTYHFTEKK